MKVETKQIERSLFIEAREWFDKINGTSYFSARIWVDGKEVSALPFQYGYGDHYLNIAQQKLVELGYLSEALNNRGLWSIGKDSGFDFYTTKSITAKREMYHA